MKYLKRKIYSLILFCLWIAIMYCLIVILFNGTTIGQLIPLTFPITIQQAVSKLYWFATIWFVILFLWYWAPHKENWGTSGKLSRSQRKKMKAMMEIPPSFPKE